MTAVSAATSRAHLQQPPPLSTRVKETATVVVQLAIRLLFIVGAILATASALPLSLHVWAIPVVALGATTLAAFFFPKPLQLDVVMRNQAGQLFIQTRNVEAALAEGLGPNAPRGLTNGLNICAPNSVVRSLQRIPPIAQWARTLTPTIEMPQFEQFLADYQTPEAIVAAFRAFVDQQDHPRPALRELFQDFLQQPIWNDFTALQETLKNVLILQRALADFFAGYDEAVRTNLPVCPVNTQRIRHALHQITQKEEFAGTAQVDAAEVLEVILNHLPPRMKMRTYLTNRYDTRGRPPIKGNPKGETRREDPLPLFQLSLPKDEFSPRLERMYRQTCLEVTTLELSNIHGNKTSYPTTIEREFIEFPPFVWFHLKRFTRDKERPSVVTLLSWIWPSLKEKEVKINTPVQAPKELPITLPTGERRLYRLATFINHEGKYGAGHYTADVEETDGRKYHMDDIQVIPGQAGWQERLEKAYLLCYLPVPAQ